MTIKQNGGIFGRNPTFNDVSVDGSITSNGIQINNGTVILDVGDEGTLQVGPTTTSADENQKIEMRGANGSNEVQRFQIENSGENGRVDFLFGRADGTPTRVMQIGALKDVLFYKDDGTTNALTFDASSGNLAFASGNGIDFSATSGTGTSELFDDYEEGTFTPVLEYDGGNGTMSVSYSAQSGQYVKIGKMVWIKCFIRLSAFSKGTASGGPCIGGLPFSMSGLDIGVAPIATYGAPFSSQVIGQPAGTQVRLMRLVNNAAYVALDDPDGNSQYYTMFCYVEN